MELLLLRIVERVQVAQLHERRVPAAVYVVHRLGGVGLMRGEALGVVVCIDYLVGEVHHVVAPVVGDVLHEAAQLLAHRLGFLQREVVHEVVAVDHRDDERLLRHHVGNRLQLQQRLHAVGELVADVIEAMAYLAGVLPLGLAPHVGGLYGVHQRVEVAHLHRLASRRYERQNMLRNLVRSFIGDVVPVLFGAVLADVGHAVLHLHVIVGKRTHLHHEVLPDLLPVRDVEIAR